MNSLAVVHTVSAYLATCLLLPHVGCRQMCWTCQFVQNGRGKEECAMAPGNVTELEPRIKCPGQCSTSAIYNLASGDLTFLYRGCEPSVTPQESGCSEASVSRYCNYWCHGRDYCNDKKLLKMPPTGKEKATNEAISALAARGLHLAGVLWLLAINYITDF